MQKERFTTLVVRVLDELPLEFQSRLENVDVVVVDWPTSRQLSSLKLRSRDQLLGLYEGVPQTKRGRHYGMVAPDKITIFQKPIEARAQSEKEIEMEIEKVVRHEIAHHFGSSEETLRRLETRKPKWRQKKAKP
jgi:predicted Zn-dependent protease with MMP-like domain